MTTVKKWKAPNGNACFCFPMRNIFERPWIIIAITFFAVAVGGIEFYVYGGCILLVPIAILLVLAFLWWIDIPLKSNDAIVAKVIHEIMDDVVNEDAKSINLNIVKSLVNHDSKGTYGIVEASCLLVLLDNEEVWEYPIIYHKPNKHNAAYFECERKYIVSKNQEHIRIINPKRRKHFINNFKFSEKTILGLLLTAILVVGGLIFVGICWLFVGFFVDFRWWPLLIFAGYGFVYSLTKYLYSKWHNKFTDFMMSAMSVPLEIICFLVNIISPFITIVGTYSSVFLLAFGVPTVILVSLSHIGWLVLKPETIVFIVFAIGSILCSSSYKTTKWMIHYTPLRDWGNHTYESYREALAIYLIHPSNVIFLLYLIYFAFLAISGFLQIENGRYLVSSKLDTAILKAFLVFIAFTNMRAKAKTTEVNIKDLFQRTLKLFVHDKQK